MFNKGKDNLEFRFEDLLIALPSNRKVYCQVMFNPVQEGNILVEHMVRYASSAPAV